ncbi:MAG: glycosyltransferase family 4 protein [Actinomycetales bacterium]|nr:glycosyltransferase family 4 protein [Actinomycetales bacterium]
MELDVSSPVLFVTNDFGPRAGGIETFVIGLIERRPVGSTIVYTSAQEGSADYDAQWLRTYGVVVIRDRAKILLPTPRVALNLARIIKEQDIKVAAFGAAAPLALLSASMKRAGVIKTVALTHGHEVWWAKVFPFTWLIRRIGSTVDTLTYLGEFTQRAISHSLSAQASKAMVKIAPGIDVDHFTPVDSTQLRKELSLEGKKVIVSVGRLVHRKGQDHLIESMPQILKSVPDAHLLIVGTGPYLTHLSKLVARNKLENHVSFIGRIQYAELPRFICAGDIFVMPSRSRLAGLEVEGLGIVYLEASSCGLPVIAGSSGGAPDAVLDGVTGFVVNGTDNEQIAQTAIELLNNPEKARAMGAAGRQWIIDNWRWEIWSARFNELLRQ